MRISLRRLFFCAVIPLLAVPAWSAEPSRYHEPYPVAASKKGLQVEMVDDALALGIKHAALNLNLSQLVELKAGPDSLAWESAGRTYHFNRAYAEAMDRNIEPLSRHGVLVNLIILAYQSPDPALNALLLHPGYSTNAPNRLGAFNTATDDGRRCFTAALEFMAERWSRPDRKSGRVVGYIIGNEVNSHWWWYHMGRVSMEQFTDVYLQAVRLAHDAVRRQCSWGRVYVSLEHHWNIRYPAGDATQSFPGRDFLLRFARRARETGGDFDWQVAFHPYPENLFEPAFWRDTSAHPTPETPRITFKNLNQLTVFMRRPEMLHKKEPRRIILSEQGFHGPVTPEGERVQAAAYCYAYKIVERLGEIDAFILHRHVDHPHEGGLLLGLRSMHPGNGEARAKKKIYECFRLADTPQWEEAFRFALPVIGIPAWP